MQLLTPFIILSLLLGPLTPAMAALQARPSFPAQNLGGQEVPSGVVGCKARPLDNTWEKYFNTPVVTTPTLYRLSATRKNQILGQTLLRVQPSSKEDITMAQGVANNLATLVARLRFDAIVQALLQGTSTVSKEQFVANTALTPLFAFVHTPGIAPAPGVLLKPDLPGTGAPPAIDANLDETQMLKQFQDTLVQEIADCSFNPKASYQDIKALIGRKFLDAIWPLWDETIEKAYAAQGLTVPTPRPTLAEAVKELKKQDDGRGYARGIAVPIQTLRILQGLASAISVWPANCSLPASWLLEHAISYNPKKYDRNAPQIDIHEGILKAALADRGITQLFALLDTLLAAAKNDNKQGLLDALKDLHALLHSTKADFQKDLDSLQEDIDRILKNDPSFPEEEDSKDTTAPQPPPKTPPLFINPFAPKKPQDMFDPKKGSLEQDALQYLQCSEQAKDHLKLRMKHEIYARVKKGLASLLKKLYFKDNGDLEQLLEAASDYSTKYRKGGVVVGMPFIGSEAFRELRKRAKDPYAARSWLDDHKNDPDGNGGLPPMPPEIPEIAKVLGGPPFIGIKNEMIVLAFTRLLANMKAMYLKDCTIKLPKFIKDTLQDTENDIRMVVAGILDSVVPTALKYQIPRALDALVETLLKIKEIRMVKRLGVRMQRFMRQEEERLIGLKKNYIKEMGTIDPLKEFFIEILKRLKEQQEKVLKGVAKK